MEELEGLWASRPEVASQRMPRACANTEGQRNSPEGARQDAYVVGRMATVTPPMVSPRVSGDGLYRSQPAEGPAETPPPMAKQKLPVMVCMPPQRVCAIATMRLLRG